MFVENELLHNCKDFLIQQEKMGAHRIPFHLLHYYRLNNDVYDKLRATKLQKSYNKSNSLTNIISKNNSVIMKTPTKWNIPLPKSFADCLTKLPLKKRNRSNLNQSNDYFSNLDIQLDNECNHKSANSVFSLNYLDQKINPLPSIRTNTQKAGKLMNFYELKKRKFRTKNMNQLIRELLQKKPFDSNTETSQFSSPISNFLKNGYFENKRSNNKNIGQNKSFDNIMTNKASPNKKKSFQRKSDISKQVNGIYLTNINHDYSNAILRFQNCFRKISGDSTKLSDSSYSFKTIIKNY